MRLFVPIILLVAAIGLFVVYTNPTYQASKALASQVSNYDNALDKSKELRAIRDQLLSKRNTFSSDDVQKLQEILPDNVDNIRIIIDINNIASRHGLTLTNVQLGTIGGGTTQVGLAAGGASSAVGSVDIGFSITTKYDSILSFIQDLEHSLRLIDIEKLGFTAGGNDADSYSFTIRTYWLH